ncbi:MAG: GntR family transcriptional regulator [Firmicutes bacterium]|nr:GntR family transcriptional regulator [Bacillota bacterium]
MLISLDMTGEEPLYLQLRNAIVLAIGSKRLREGEGLPSVRQLAEDLGINAMTVNKAYTLLKDQGFIEIDRRQGAKVLVAGEAHPHFPERWQEQLTLLLAEGYARGLGRKELLEIYETLCNNLLPEGETD